ncbi:glycosyltransferase [Pseudomonas stutzeri]|uniref:glycosyltransferase n=1 Tax=Stutzerimonas stutzeri TaxID=316 RepID=UPI00210CCC44|nr:glycosyltransferase [Stutzerimonas stutzeri]MCQ4230891.1 glycosyltransferase [Stutzerimonas stutzeri]
MKILYVVTGLGVGGAEHVVVNLANRAHSEGQKVKIVYMTGAVEVRPESSEIELVSLGMSTYLSFFYALWRFIKVVNAFKPDVVHSHMYHANMLARSARVFTCIPNLVCSAHSSNEGGKLRMWLYRVTNSLCDVFTNVSKAAAAEIELAGAASAGTIVPVLNGVDVKKFRRFSYPENDFFTIVAIGRLEEAKDYPCLLHAIKILTLKFSRFKLKIVGDGSLRPSLSILASELGIADKIEWLGVRKDIPEILNQSDLFVLSSAWEGFGLVVAEAMACELPVVATDCGGVKEVIGDIDRLVNIKDPQALAEKLEIMIKLPAEERKKIGSENRGRIVSYYSLDAMYQSYNKLY